jgi:hypothetical protein
MEDQAVIAIGFGPAHITVHHAINGLSGGEPRKVGVQPCGLTLLYLKALFGRLKGAARERDQRQGKD